MGSRLWVVLQVLALSPWRSSAHGSLSWSPEGDRVVAWMFALPSTLSTLVQHSFADVVMARTDHEAALSKVI